MIFLVDLQIRMGFSTGHQITLVVFPGQTPSFLERFMTGESISAETTIVLMVDSTLPVHVEILLVDTFSCRDNFI